MIELRGDFLKESDLKFVFADLRMLIVSSTVKNTDDSKREKSIYKGLKLKFHLLVEIS